MKWAEYLRALARAVGSNADYIYYPYIPLICPWSWDRELSKRRGFLGCLPDFYFKNEFIPIERMREKCAVVLTAHAKRLRDGKELLLDKPLLIHLPFISRECGVPAEFRTDGVSNDVEALLRFARRILRKYGIDT